MNEARDEIAWEKIRWRRRSVVMVKMMKDEFKCEEERGVFFPVGWRGVSNQGPDVSTFKTGVGNNQGSI